MLETCCTASSRGCRSGSSSKDRGSGPWNRRRGTMRARQHRAALCNGHVLGIKLCKPGNRSSEPFQLNLCFQQQPGSNVVKSTCQRTRSQHNVLGAGFGYQRGMGSKKHTTKPEMRSKDAKGGCGRSRSQGTGCWAWLCRSSALCGQAQQGQGLCPLLLLQKPALSGFRESPHPAPRGHLLPLPPPKW